MYDTLLSTINMIFNKEFSVLFRPVTSAVKNSYYIATGTDLSESRHIVKTLGPTNDALFTSRDIPTAKYPSLCIVKNDDERVPNILYIDNRMTFICFVPVDIDDDDFNPIERIQIIHSIYKYVIGNTATIIDDANSIMSVAQNVLAEYLTILTMRMCFIGFNYKMFREIDDFSKISQKQYNRILDTDDPFIFNYSYIYAIMKEKE